MILLCYCKFLYAERTVTSTLRSFQRPRRSQCCPSSCPSWTRPTSRWRSWRPTSWASLPTGWLPCRTSHSHPFRYKLSNSRWTLWTLRILSMYWTNLFPTADPKGVTKVALWTQHRRPLKAQRVGYWKSCHVPLQTSKVNLLTLEISWNLLLATWIVQFEWYL